VSGDDPNFNLGNDSSVRYANVIADGDPNKQTAVWGGYNTKNGGATGGVIDTSVRGDIGNYDASLDVDQIIESGRSSLDWFHLVQARYALTGHTMPAGMPLGSQTQIDDLYNQQKGMKVNPLFGAGERITQQLSQIETAHDDQKNATGQLAQHWQGQTGTAAHDKLTELATWSDDAADEIKALPDVIGHAVDEIKKAVQIKVDAFNKLKDIHRINGVDMTNGESKGKGINTRDDDDANSGNDDVSLIINYSMRRGIGTDTRKMIQWIADTGVFGPRTTSLLPHYNPDRKDDEEWEGPEYGANVGAGKNVFDNKAQKLCEIWTQQFIESAEGYFGAYKNICDQADQAITGYLKVVVDAINHAGHRNKPPTPGTPNSSNTPSSPGPGPGPGPSSTSASGSGTGTDSSGSGTGTSGSGLGTSRTGTSGTSTITSAFNTLASGITGLGTLVQTAESAVSQVSSLGSTFSSLSQSVTQGLGSLTTQVQQGLDGILGTHNASSNVPGTTGKPVAEFDVAGKQLKLEQGKNGALELVLADSAGKGKSYILELDEHGVPVITSQDESGTGHSTSDASSSGRHSSTDKKSDDQSTGSQKSTDQSDGSHKPTDQPTGNPGTTSDSGGGNSSSAVIAPVAPPAQTTGGGNDNSKPTTQSPQQFDSGAELAESGPL